MIVLKKQLKIYFQEGFVILEVEGKLWKAQDGVNKFEHV